MANSRKLSWKKKMEIRNLEDCTNNTFECSNTCLLNGVLHIWSEKIADTVGNDSTAVLTNVVRTQVLRQVAATKDAMMGSDVDHKSTNFDEVNANKTSEC
jgi:hypothetical protein